MTQTFIRADGMKIVVIALVGLIILPLTPGARQRWNLHLAQVHADKLRTTLSKDPHFNRVQVSTYTGGGGSLMLTGEINNVDDKAALKKLVDTTHPPVNVFYMTITSAELHKWDGTDAKPAETTIAK